MQGLEIGSQQGSAYGPIDPIPDLGPGSGDLNFENLDSSLHQGGAADSNQGMAWFDTDLWTLGGRRQVNETPVSGRIEMLGVETNERSDWLVDRVVTVGLKHEYDISKVF